MCAVIRTSSWGKKGNQKSSLAIKKFENPVLVYTDCMRNTAHKKVTSNESLGDHACKETVSSSSYLW